VRKELGSNCGAEIIGVLSRRGTDKACIVAPQKVVRHYQSMAGYDREKSASPQEPGAKSSRAWSGSLRDTQFSPRIGLPSDLAGSLKHLDDAQLQRLHQAISLEISRRNPAAFGNILPTATASRGRNDNADAVDEVPAGKANLIWASFKAGVTPAFIARTFGISQSLVNRVLVRLGNPHGDLRPSYQAFASAAREAISK
jgi:hypothetical protein